MATVLIANSDHRFSQTLAQALRAYGHETLTTRTGEETLEAFKAAAPSVVLLDFTLLGLSGLDVLAHIKAAAPHLPVVAVTGDAPPDVETRAREMGVTDVLRKRLKMDVLMQAINSTLRHAGRPDRPTPFKAAPDKAKTILVVDDELEICEMVGEFLQRRGYRVVTANDGEDALAKIDAHQPDLVLLDIYMPGMNGVEVLRELDGKAPSIGVIMLTASQDELLLKQALDLGAFDVLPKPVDLDQVEMAVMVKLAMQE